MGFSVSGSLVVVGLGVFIALSTFYTAASNAGERVAEAEGDHLRHAERVSGSAVAIDSVSLLDGVDCGVEVAVNNTGETALHLNRTDLLLDNTYRTDWQEGATVDGDGSTYLWLPGEQLTVTDSDLTDAPDRVKVVSGPGVADTTEVSGLLC